MSDAKAHAAVLAQAIERLKLASEAEAAQRTREKDDLRFQVPELQWPEDVKGTRGAQIVAGVPIPPRPMLSIPKLDQPIQLVLNREKAAHLGVQVHALSADASDDTAEIIQGLYRRIEVDSRASLARSWAFERAVKVGRGCYRVLTEYAPESGETKDQNIVIKRMLHQDSVYFDPFAEEPDWSDGEWAFITSWVPFSRYKRNKDYRDSKLAQYDGGELEALIEEKPDWIRGDGDDDTRAVLVVEYFCVTYDDEGNRSVSWYKLNAIEVLDEQPWPGQYIPIVPVIGRELIPFDGQRRWDGIIGPNKDAQRLFNYAASASVEAAALEPKAPFDVDPEEIENFEAWWNQANTRNFPYLPRHKYLHGQVMPPVQRIQADTSKMQINALLLSQAGDFIHAGTGAFEPSLGQNSPNVRTKGQTLALQQQHEEGNSHWLDNLAEISLTYEAKVILDLIPKIYDRPGRVARILDLEDNKESVMFNQPFTTNAQGRPIPVDPKRPGANPEQVKHYDLKRGRYGVSVSVGKAYKSRLEEGNDMLGQLFQAEPELFKILGDIWLGFQSWPGHKAAEARMKKMLPPPLQDEDGQQNAEMQLQQAKAQLQQMQQQLQEMGKALETDKVKADAQIAQAKIKASVDLQKTVMDNATKLAVARITAAKAALDAVREDVEESMALGQQQQHEAQQAAMDRQHEMNLAQQQHEQAMQQAQQAHDSAVVQAEQGQDHALQQGEQNQAGVLAQQQQAADLAPEPEAGA